jgi:beta-phosphoglucomutase family hydrolase
MNFKAFIFDMDGTLVDNMGIHTQIWVEFMTEMGVTIEPVDFTNRTLGKVNPEIIRDFIDPNLTEAQIDEISARKEALYRERFLPELKGVAGLREFLTASQSRGIPMAVATSARIENVTYVLDGIALRPFFAAVLSAEDITRGKPDPEIFLAAARRLGVDPASCLVFEDSPLGIEAARRAGMHAVALATTYPASRFDAEDRVLKVAPNFTTFRPEDWYAD